MPDLRDHGGNFGGGKTNIRKDVYSFEGNPTTHYGITGLVYALDLSKGESISRNSTLSQLVYVKEGAVIKTFNMANNMHQVYLSLSTDKTYLAGFYTVVAGDMYFFNIDLSTMTKSAEVSSYMNGNFHQSHISCPVFYKEYIYMYIYSSGNYVVGKVHLPKDTSSLVFRINNSLYLNSSTVSETIPVVSETGRLFITRAYSENYQNQLSIYEFSDDISTLVKFYQAAPNSDIHFVFSPPSQREVIYVNGSMYSIYDGRLHRVTLYPDGSLGKTLDLKLNTLVPGLWQSSGTPFARICYRNGKLGFLFYVSTTYSELVGLPTAPVFKTQTVGEEASVLLFSYDLSTSIAKRVSYEPFKMDSVKISDMRYHRVLYYNYAYRGIWSSSSILVSNDSNTQPRYTTTSSAISVV